MLHWDTESKLRAFNVIETFEATLTSRLFCLPMHNADLNLQCDIVHQSLHTCVNLSSIALCFFQN